MSRGPEHARKQQRRIILSAIICIIVLVQMASVAHTDLTLASWNTKETAEGNFSAATVGPVRDPVCVDSSLITLGRDQVSLSWTSPEITQDVPITYRIRWREVGLLDSIEGEVDITATQYTHTRQTGGLLSSLVGLRINLDIIPVIDGTSWEGPPQAIGATVVSVLGLLNIRVLCD